MASTFTTFWNSSLHGVRAPKGVRAFYVTEQGGVSPVFQNGGGHDAEDYVISSVRQLCLRHTGCLLRVRVFQSLSPCGRCSQRYLALMRESFQQGTHLRLELSFAGLYKMTRPSCRRKGCKHCVPDNQHNRQLRGLKKLKGCEVLLKTFDYPAWVTLCQCLGLQTLTYAAYRGKREAEDVSLAQDLKSLLGSWTSLVQQVSQEDGPLKHMRTLQLDPPLRPSPAASARPPRLEAGLPAPRMRPRVSGTSSMRKPSTSTATTKATRSNQTSSTRNASTSTAATKATRITQTFGTAGVGHVERAITMMPYPARSAIGFSSGAAELGETGGWWGSQTQSTSVAVTIPDDSEVPWRRDSSRWRCSNSCLCIGLAALVYTIVVILVIIFKQL